MADYVGVPPGCNWRVETVPSGRGNTDPLRERLEQLSEEGLNVLQVEIHHWPGDIGVATIVAYRRQDDLMGVDAVQTTQFLTMAPGEQTIVPSDAERAIRVVGYFVVAQRTEASLPAEFGWLADPELLPTMIEMPRKGGGSDHSELWRAPQTLWYAGAIDSPAYRIPTGGSLRIVISGPVRVYGHVTFQYVVE